MTPRKVLKFLSWVVLVAFVGIWLTGFVHTNGWLALGVVALFVASVYGALTL